MKNNNLLSNVLLGITIAQTICLVLIATDHMVVSTSKLTPVSTPVTQLAELPKPKGW